MRAHNVAVAVTVATMAIVGTSACSADSSARPRSASQSAATPLQGRLRDGLLTQAQLPDGFQALTEQVNATTTGAPHARASTVSIASMPCPELGVGTFMTVHAPPVEDVAVGLEQVPDSDSDSDGDGYGDDEGWFGQESLDRYAPGRAAAVMDAIRGAAQRCPSYTDTFVTGTHGQSTVSVTGADVQADDSLVLRITTTMPEVTDPFISETAFVREGDVILMVQKVVGQKPRSGVEAVLPAAVAAYRTAAAG
ncbi:hypothetical protein OG523_03175 [Streptomyces virginiae]|uniref:hypothetical protein n=1 Tax=Streptomyces virginiae TaxID=1961 RepID=UPI002E2F58EC|nr:hypothetical protein [Streptomyces virginiae]